MAKGGGAGRGQPGGSGSGGFVSPGAGFRGAAPGPARRGSRGRLPGKREANALGQEGSPCHRFRVPVLSGPCQVPEAGRGKRGSLSDAPAACRPEASAAAPRIREGNGGSQAAGNQAGFDKNRQTRPAPSLKGLSVSRAVKIFLPGKKVFPFPLDPR